MSPVAQADRHDGPGLVDEPVPGVTAMLDDVVVRAEDSVGEPVVADELPDVFDWVEFGRFRRQRHQGDVVRDIELGREMPTGLIEKQDGVGAWHDRPGDFRQMQCHGGGVAEGQDEARAGSPCWANGAEDVGRARPLIVRRRWPRPAPCPSPCDLVLLPDPGFVLEPDFYRLARRIPRRDLVQAGGEVLWNGPPLLQQRYAGWATEGEE